MPGRYMARHYQTGWAGGGGNGAVMAAATASAAADRAEWGAGGGRRSWAQLRLGPAAGSGRCRESQYRGEETGPDVVMAATVEPIQALNAQLSDTIGGKNSSELGTEEPAGGNGAAGSAVQARTAHGGGGSEAV
jgi:Pyruvate/2-oxoacid:ferredoxin oxidoreductase gamma subunit